WKRSCPVRVRVPLRVGTPSENVPTRERGEPTRPCCSLRAGRQERQAGINQERQAASNRKATPASSRPWAGCGRSIRCCRSPDNDQPECRCWLDSYEFLSAMLPITGIFHISF